VEVNMSVKSLVMLFLIVIGITGCDQNKTLSNNQASEKPVEYLAYTAEQNTIIASRALTLPGNPPAQPTLLNMRAKKSLVGTVDQLIDFPSNASQRGGFWMMGQLVLFDNATFLPSLDRNLITPGATLEVWGYPIAKGEIIATRIVEADQFRINKNYLYAVVKDFNITTSMVTAGYINIDLSKIPSNNLNQVIVGNLFEVSGEINNLGVLVANDFTMLDFPSDAAGRYFSNLIEGPVTLSDYANGSLEVLGIPIVINESTEVVGIDPSLIEVGNIISVRGFDLSSPVDQIIFEKSSLTDATEIKILGGVFILNESTSTFSVLSNGFVNNIAVNYADAISTTDFKNPNNYWFMISGRSPITSNVLNASHISSLSIPNGTFYPIPNSIYVSP